MLTLANIILPLSLLPLCLIALCVLYNRGRKRHFIRLASAEQKHSLSAAAVPFEAGSLERNGTPGVFIKGRHLKRACRALNAYRLTSWRTKRRHVLETILRPIVTLNAADVGARVSFINGSRRNTKPDRRTQKRVSALVRETITPVAGCDVMVHQMRGQTVAPIQDGRFHIFVHSSSGAARTVVVPNTLCGVRYAPVVPRNALSPYRVAVPIIDNATHFIIGEFVAPNCLYLHHSALAGEGRKLAQLAAILDAAGPHLSSDTGLDEVIRQLAAEATTTQPPATLPTVSARGFAYRQKNVMTKLVQAALVGVVDGEIMVENCAGKAATLNDRASPRIMYNSRPTATAAGAAIGSPTGTPIALDNGDIAAEIQGKTLFVFSDQLRFCNRESVAQLGNILAQARDEWRQEPGTDLAAARFARDALKAIDAIAPSPTGNVEQEFSQAERLAQEWLKKARTTERELLQGGTAPERELGKEFDRLLAMRKVRDVEVTHNAIVVHTNMIYCIDPRTNLVHEIGKFQIHLNFSGTVQFFNEIRTGRFHAPHVNEAGNPCLGNIRTVMPDLIHQRQLASAAQVAIAFLESVNVNDGWGQHINRWPVAHGRRTIN
jgi:hypothetical protein